MIIRHTEQQVNDYYERAELNQSSLKVILEDGMQTFLAKAQSLMTRGDLYYEEKKHFVIGTGVDYRLSYGEDSFKGRYHLSELIKKPGPKVMSVLKLAYDKAMEEFAGIDSTLTLYRKQVFDACNEEDYYSNRKNKENNHELDTRIGTILKDNGQEYWMDLWTAQGKQILSDDEQTIITTVSSSFLTHPHTTAFFKDSKDTDVIFQLPMFWIVDGVSCKGMIDLLRVDHKRKRIYPMDMKTMWDFVLRFNKALLKRRYDIQGSFYSFGLSLVLEMVSELLGKDVTNYEIAEFAFLAESTVRPGTPMTFPLNKEMLKIAEFGSEEFGLRGWREGVATYKRWSEVEFSVDRMFESTNGVLFITPESLNSII